MTMMTLMKHSSKDQSPKLFIRKKTGIRMKRVDEKSSIQTKDCKIKETYEIYCTTIGQSNRNKQEIK